MNTAYRIPTKAPVCAALAWYWAIHITVNNRERLYHVFTAVPAVYGTVGRS